MAATRFQTLIFDLDDTLIPTSEVLIPQAAQHVFQLLSENGLKWSFSQFEEYRKKHIVQHSHREIIKMLIEEKKLGPKGHIYESCMKAFYHASLPNEIPLLPGAKDNLEQLTKNYRLFLLTGGDENTQKQKLIKAKIQDYFTEVVVAGAAWRYNKKAVIENWLQKNQLLADKTLSIGNRLNDEIRASKILGLSTCHFKYGEHADETPQDHFENADFEINNHSELIKTCKL